MHRALPKYTRQKIPQKVLAVLEREDVSLHITEALFEDLPKHLFEGGFPALTQIFRGNLSLPDSGRPRIVCRFGPPKQQAPLKSKPEAAPSGDRGPWAVAVWAVVLDVSNALLLVAVSLAVNLTL